MPDVDLHQRGLGGKRLGRSFLLLLLLYDGPKGSSGGGSSSAAPKDPLQEWQQGPLGMPCLVFKTSNRPHLVSHRATKGRGGVRVKGGGEGEEASGRPVLVAGTTVSWEAVPA